MPATPQIERHPLKPFLPANAQLLMLGSFPPPKERWCMDFFYPNPQNDMWRIMGHIFYGDKTHFEEQGDFMKVPRDQVQSTKAGRKVFNREEIASFCETKCIAIFDTAQAVIRLQGNAADEHLEICEPTDIAALLQPIPLCHDICCTGGKAGDNGPEMAVGARIQIPAECQERTGQAGHCDAQVQNGDFRQRLFLMKRNRRTEIASGGWYEE